MLGADDGALFGALLRRHRRAATSRATTSCTCPRAPEPWPRELGMTPSELARRSSAAAPMLLRRARAARPARPRREGADRLERADARAPSPRPAASLGARRLPRRGRAQRRVRAGAQLRARRPAAAHLEGRPGAASTATWRTTPSSPTACWRSTRRPSSRAGSTRRARWPSEMLDLFWDDERRGFFDTGADHEQLIARPRDLFDNAMPSRQLGGGRRRCCAWRAHRRAALRRARARKRSAAGRLIARASRRASAASCARSTSTWARAWRSRWSARATGGAAPLGGEVFGRYRPNRVVAGCRAADDPRRRRRAAARARGLWTAGPGLRLRDYACELPVTDRPRSRDSSTLGYNPDRVAGGGFLRTGCGPGPLELAPGNSSEGNATRGITGPHPFLERCAVFS